MQLSDPIEQHNPPGGAGAHPGDEPPRAHVSFKGLEVRAIHGVEVGRRLRVLPDPARGRPFPLGSVQAIITN